jgi:hypothetical protein
VWAAWMSGPAACGQIGRSARTRTRIRIRLMCLFVDNEHGSGHQWLWSNSDQWAGWLPMYPHMVGEPGGDPSLRRSRHAKLDWIH